MYYIIMPDIRDKRYFKQWGSNGEINLAKHFNQEEAEAIINQNSHWRLYQIHDNGTKSIIHRGGFTRYYSNDELPF